MGNVCVNNPSLCHHQKLLLLRKIASQKETAKENIPIRSASDQPKHQEEKNGAGGEANWGGGRAEEDGGGQNGNAEKEGIIGGELTARDKDIIACCWRKHIVTDRADLFHKTMLLCIEASPKLNEIIACGRYCYRDLTKWPKLNRICQAQFKFYERLIYELNMDERRMRDQCTRLGQTHAEYAQFGLKPHFLDIYQQSLIAIISKLKFADGREREETVRAFSRLIRLIIDSMIDGYGQRAIELRRNRRGSGSTETTADERGASDDELRIDQKVTE